MGIRKNIHSQVNTNIKWNSVQKEFKKLMELHTNMKLLREYIFFFLFCLYYISIGFISYDQLVTLNLCIYL